MKLLKHRLLSLFTSFCLLLSFAPAVHAATISDVDGHWAESAIRALVQSEVINGYPNGKFKPDQSITRAELAKILATAYGLNKTGQTKFSDTKGHWAEGYIATLAEKEVFTGYPDGTFQPERPVNRAEIITMLIRMTNLGTAEEKYTFELEPSFPDVAEDFWAFKYVEIANRLGILPANYKDRFQPDRLASRAETAWMVQTLRNLKVVTGKILDNGDNSGFLTIETNSGDVENVLVMPDTIVFRNNVTTTAEKIQKNDNVTIYSNPSGEYRFVKAFGEVTKDDLLSQISAYAQGKITPEQVTAILSGDWDTVTEELKGSIYDRLVEFGLTPPEAESILVRDWEHLDTLSRDRLAEAISDYLGITSDLSRAILDQDFERAKEYAKIELATMALGRLMQR
ncbi:MAG TPA: S-layer homology domain-containing protein [Firmicutes bacterium]|jgi:hypothetical protein|nr:S-layer homology domain-containing protein [Bacillota bacterium]HOQ23049.1 S-layer homology domain-containing protein [Bacillota bacterium]HPT66947.1 S-layer homology domain-containing protein [Bacillota bacterium]